MGKGPHLTSHAGCLLDMAYIYYRQGFSVWGLISLAKTIYCTIIYIVILRRTSFFWITQLHLLIAYLDLHHMNALSHLPISSEYVVFSNDLSFGFWVLLMCIWICCCVFGLLMCFALTGYCNLLTKKQQMQLTNVIYLCFLFNFSSCYQIPARFLWANGLGLSPICVDTYHNECVLCSGYTFTWGSAELCTVPACWEDQALGGNQQEH